MIVSGIRLPIRAVRVPGCGKPLHVPRYIVRLDIDAGNRGGPLHGWQLRYQRCQLIPDRDYGNDPTRSLAAAIATLKRWIRRAPRKPRLRTAELSRKKCPIGVRGVSLTTKCRRPGGVRQLSILICVPVWGNRSSRNLGIYVGTPNTITRERLQQSLKRAVAIRRFAEQCYRRHDIRSVQKLTTKQIPAAARRIENALVLSKVPRVVW